MSHFIQDNQCVVETKDEVLLLLIKGGDNNCASSYTNNRVSSWRIHSAFKSYEDLMFFVNYIALEDIAGGSWQFQSLKNKSFNGYFEYESIAINRFKKAYNNRIKVDFAFSDILFNNIEEKTLQIEKAMQSKSFKIIDEDGRYCSLCPSYILDSEKNFNDWLNCIQRTGIKNSLSKEKIEIIKHYDSFIEKFKDKDIVECLQELEFIEKYVNTNRWHKAEILLEKKLGRHNVSYEIFRTIISNDLSNFITGYDYIIKDITKQYPLYIRDIKKEFMKEFEKIATSFTENYIIARVKENLQLIESFSDERLEEMQKEVDIALQEKEQKRKENAVSVFIDIWNKLDHYAYYKSTDSLLPRKIKEMSDALATNTFKLEDIRGRLTTSFTPLIMKHSSQLKKNKKAIKDLVQLLFDEYSEMINENEKERLIEYFKIKVNKKSKKEGLKIAATIGVALYSQELLDIFSKGTLF